MAHPSFNVGMSKLNSISDLEEAGAEVQQLIDEQYCGQS